MKEYINKIVHQILDKWIVIVIMTLGGGIGTAAYDYFQRFFSLPEKVLANEVRDRQKDKEDSTYHLQVNTQIKYLIEAHKRDSDFLAQDYEMFLEHKWIKPLKPLY